MQAMEYECAAIAARPPLKTVRYLGPDKEPLLELSIGQNRLQQSTFLQSMSNFKNTASPDELPTIDLEYNSNCGPQDVEQLFSIMGSGSNDPIYLNDSFHISKRFAQSIPSYWIDDSLQESLHLAYFNKKTSAMQGFTAGCIRWKKLYKKAIDCFDESSVKLQKRIGTFSEENGFLDYLYEQMYSSSRWCNVVNKSESITHETDYQERISPYIKECLDSCVYAQFYQKLVQHKKSCASIKDNITDFQGIESLHDVYRLKKCPRYKIKEGDFYHSHLPQLYLLNKSYLNNRDHLLFEFKKTILKKILTIDILSTPFLYISLVDNFDVKLNFDYQKLAHAHNVVIHVHNCPQLDPYINGPKVPSLPLIKREEQGYTLYSNVKNRKECIHNGCKFLFTAAVIVGSYVSYCYLSDYLCNQEEKVLAQAFEASFSSSTKNVDILIKNEPYIFGIQQDHPIINILKEKYKTSDNAAAHILNTDLTSRVMKIKEIIQSWNEISNGSIHWALHFFFRFPLLSGVLHGIKYLRRMVKNILVSPPHRAFKIKIVE